MSAEKKYELTDKTREVDGVTVRRIRALRNGCFAVNKGDLGGWVQSEVNLSQHGKCWVYGDAVVTGDARVTGNAVIRGQARATGNASITCDAVVTNRATVSGHAVVSDNAAVGDTAMVTDYAMVYGQGRVYDAAMISENSTVSGTALIDHDALVTGTGRVEIGHVSNGATVSRRDEVLVVTGFLQDTVTVYRAMNRKAGHVVIAGCQRFTLEDTEEKLLTMATDHGWTLLPGWKHLRLALKGAVQVWQGRTGAQGCDSDEHD